MLPELNAISSIKFNLPLFRWAQQSVVANFRCIVCGDSKKNQRKARGYLVKHKDTFFYKCHKCGYSKPLSSFLYEHFPSQYHDYKLEKLKELSSDKQPIIADSVVVAAPTIVQTIDSVATLPRDHPAKVYLTNRQIPTPSLEKILYTDNFGKYVMGVSGMDKYKRLPNDKRIVLEMRDARGKLFGVQGRAIEKSSQLRYITIKFDDSKPKMFGLENLNTSLPVTVVEGGIDSLFIPNSIALCGGDVSLSLNFLKGKDVIVALDNEPRSRDTVSRIKRAIDMGFSVCIWDIDSNLKDINDMVLSGITADKIHTHIKENSYSGLRANVKLNFWKKV